MPAALLVLVSVGAGTLAQAVTGIAAATGVLAGLGPGQLLARRAPPGLARRIVPIVAAAGGLAVIVQFLA